VIANLSMLLQGKRRRGVVALRRCGKQTSGWGSYGAVAAGAVFRDRHPPIAFVRACGFFETSLFTARRPGGTLRCYYIRPPEIDHGRTNDIARRSPTFCRPALSGQRRRRLVLWQRGEVAAQLAVLDLDVNAFAVPRA